MRELFTTQAQAFRALEIARREWLAEAREVALRIAEGRRSGSVCSDDIWQACPPPPGADPRCMGPVFSRGPFERAYMRPSMRPECHRRPIQVWRLPLA